MIEISDTIAETYTGQQNPSLAFSVFVATLLHAVMILGIDFSSSQHHSIPPTLEITIATQPAELEQDNADFLAQTDQEASGTANEKQQMTTDQISAFKDTVAREIQNELRLRSTTDTPIRDKSVITSTASNNNFTVNNTVEDRREISEIFLDDDSDTLIPDRSEIATLHARLDRLRQEYAKKPRISTLTAVSAKSAPEAEYLAIWQEKIERLGNRYYPEEARSRKISGSLRLLVAIDSNGEVANIRITQSSGQPVLDNAAIMTVKLASPFPPFPPELRKHVDQLEIIRTWQFGKGSLSTR
ncbi:MAG: energy transducer TonB [Pseudomonadales bacterium]|nr:energy transducer TonB [Pseudomonadales bacterium]